MRAFVPLLLAALVAATPAFADQGGHDDDRSTLERARERGDVQPLARIVELLREQGIAGELLEVELEREDDGLVYEIYVLGNDGRRLELTVDPATGRILDMERD
jgi:uncharacterized membrane protein YkoI